jgi:hypothetical protein
MSRHYHNHFRNLNVHRDPSGGLTAGAPLHLGEHLPSTAHMPCHSRDGYLVLDGKEGPQMLKWTTLPRDEPGAPTPTLPHSLRSQGRA